MLLLFQRHKTHINAHTKDEDARAKLLTCVNDREKHISRETKLLTEIKATMATAFSSLVRSDGVMRRFLQKELSLEEYEAKLRSSAIALQTSLATTLRETRAEGPECALTLVSLREVVTDFCTASATEIGAEDKDLRVRRANEKMERQITKERQVENDREI